MATRQTVDTALQAVEKAMGQSLDEAQSQKIRLAIEEALGAAIKAGCEQTTDVVEEKLKHDGTLARQIREEAELRRKALVSNLSAAR